jgi:peptidoglycan-N-acetylglucosamine deacetylase
VKLLTLTLLAAMLSLAAERQVVITFDDLPRGGDGGGLTLPEIRQMTEKLVAPFSAGRIPFAGFVNAGRARAIGDDGLREILNLWLDAGATLGNHTYSHPDINRVPLAEYQADVLKGEPILREVLAARGQTLRYFRHPFLHTGSTAQDKRGLADFLRQHNYVEAPVTLDDAD